MSKSKRKSCNRSRIIVIHGTSSLGKKQRLIFNEFWNANESIFIRRGILKKNAVAIWLDGVVYGKHGIKWKPNLKKVMK